MQKIKLWYFIVMVLLLASCAATPPVDTENKRFLAFETSYKNTLQQIDIMDKNKSFKQETRGKIATALEKVNVARGEAYNAKKYHDTATSTSKLDIANALLNELIKLLPQGGQL